MYLYMAIQARQQIMESSQDVPYGWTSSKACVSSAMEWIHPRIAWLQPWTNTAIQGNVANSRHIVGENMMKYDMKYAPKLIE
jgi:hypothetical protein